MVEVTRKLLLVVCDFETVDYLRANLPLRVHEQVFELPSAEELGHAALEASAEHFAKTNGDIDDPYRAEWIGQAILDLLTKGI